MLVKLRAGTVKITTLDPKPRLPEGILLLFWEHPPRLFQNIHAQVRANTQMPPLQVCSDVCTSTVTHSPRRTQGHSWEHLDCTKSLVRIFRGVGVFMYAFLTINLCTFYFYRFCCKEPRLLFQPSSCHTINKHFMFLCHPPCCE